MCVAAGIHTTTTYMPTLVYTTERIAEGRGPAYFRIFPRREALKLDKKSDGCVHVTHIQELDGLQKTTIIIILVDNV